MIIGLVLLAMISGKYLPIFRGVPMSIEPLTRGSSRNSADDILEGKGDIKGQAMWDHNIKLQQICSKYWEQDISKHKLGEGEENWIL